MNDSVESSDGNDTNRFAVRANWYIFVGWWLSAAAVVIAWFAGITIVGIPVMVYLVNRLPIFLTVGRRQQFMSNRDIAVAQYRGVLRVIYVICIGWWLSAIAMAVGWLLYITLVHARLGVTLITRQPYLYSLDRRYAESN